MPKPFTPQQQSGFLSRFGTSAKRWIASHVSPAEQISQADTFLYGAGVTTAASLLGSGSRQARTRQAIYDKWAMMEGDPIVSTALLLLVTSALGGHETSGNMIFVETATEAKTDKRRAKIAEEVAAELGPLFNRVAFSIGYTGATFGDSYARVYSNRSGVVDLYIDEQVRPPLVQPYEQGSRTIGYAVYTGPKNFERLDVTQMARLKMPRTQWVPQHGVIEKALRLAISEDDPEMLPVMPSMAGGSLLYNAEGPYDNLAASLLGLVGQRWMDSIDEQMLQVNLSEMTKEQQTRFLASVTQMLSRSKSYAEEAVKSGKPRLERIRHLLPVFGDKQLSTISSANGQGSGRSATISIEDVMLHARMLSGSLGVDLSMLGFADQLAGGLGEGGFFRTSAQAAERARVIRWSMADFFNQIADIHTLRRYGYVFDEKTRPWVINYYGSISALESEKQRTRTDSMNSGALMVQAMQQFKDMGADEKMMTEFLTKVMMVDEDQAKLYAKIVNAKPPDEEGGGGFGGGGPGGFGGSGGGGFPPPKRQPPGTEE